MNSTERVATMFGPIIIICGFLFAGTGARVSNLKAAHNTTVELTCAAPSNARFPPAWVMNGSLLLADDGYTTSRDEVTGELIGTLVINGNHTCGTFHANCRLSSGLIMHNTTLTIEGHLPPPEDIHIDESNNFLDIEWNPPYSAINTNSSVIHIDPHITQYTVYIVDNYTGYYMEKVNVTEMSFRRNIPNDNSCPVYRVTAWNSGGEGDMSVPLPGARVPNSIAAEDIVIHTEPGVVNIFLNVTDPCTLRIPDYFLVTVISTDGVITPTVQHPVTTLHITTIHVTLPQNDDNCNLTVRINAGNSAGVSSPTNITVGCPTTDYSTDATTTTSIGSDTTSTDLVDQRQQKDIIYIAVGISVGIVVIVAVVIVTVGALLLIILWRCKRTMKVKPPEENVYSKKEEKRNTKERAKNAYEKSPSLRRPPVHHSGLPCISPPAVVDATTKSHSGMSSTDSSGSDKLSGSTGLVNASIDPEKQNQPQPPASDNNQMQYAQMQQQDQL